MHSQSAPATVCLITDRLSAGMLGAYGNAWIGTPCFDRLAFSSVLADQMMLTAPTLEAFYDAVWRRASAAVDPIARSSASPGLGSLLVTDEVALSSIDSGFAHVSIVEQGSFADETMATETEKFFSAAADHLIALDEPTFVWLHTQCLADNWDAPYAMRAWYAAEDDPSPPTSQVAPHFDVGPNTDPDELLGCIQAYAAQVSLWDQCLGQLIEVIDNHPIFKDALLIVAGCRGFPLGEHRCVGKGSGNDSDCDLYSELLHLPLLYRVPGGQKAGRFNQLMQPEDLYDILHRWNNRGFEEDKKARADFQTHSKETRSAIISQHVSGSWAVRTPAWFFHSQSDTNNTKELYFKPDDRWEVNNVAERCDDVVVAIEQLYENASQGKPIEPLDRVLLRRF